MTAAEDKLAAALAARADWPGHMMFVPDDMTLDDFRALGDLLAQRQALEAVARASKRLYDVIAECGGHNALMHAHGVLGKALAKLPEPPT